MEQLFVSSSTEETQEIAAHLASGLDKGATICLYGDLAAGKTTFTQGFASFFKIPRLVSPTFIIMREYPITSHPVIKTLYHLDLYRLNSVQEIKAFDVEEIWTDPTNLLIIEWPDKFVDILPQKRVDVFFHATSENEREIKIIKNK
ncbi:tRNA (adenosine(37)-N6)-threonylcarbamoyltransferase complex ATPase subunit type 1 TsaE [Candidatus Collierbacteria bacterium CG1_02_44_10]|uniref:tRNA threonylcarbamoyladenosine biosynthesis protein TsaE n=4 Tax=Candidatus Collieribacteriota TaxID=1752725 RepID=A0A2H0DV66_9BACT|nr:tRNA (adenosine(37)-N6)-threonylcarbamoyltransferase complex ATPase subunit type 1 TsaE [bacterium]OIN92259.1 MAG: tRNA (adenosine(37)-N6)-threonylcarbamoyltransferase complex ATPase subunit type 1 TsaE [Candidatus Collierbacteria bacterium CG1_02_44_10]PIP86067.1 MAG: tRNA (adenosine(37)-N6)-threonylcarbamoyltransferase complex ATPase subunit type 1 TsaE [Candidatus Collierbacteria bacterium CG22_combo_CG10-13_8_21_14_all_43_12]PIR99931.1 MAG: tRNA (adenosine(37)-N6)-threonylcarbamoyltransfe